MRVIYSHLLSTTNSLTGAEIGNGWVMKYVDCVILWILIF